MDSLDSFLPTPSRELAVAVIVPAKDEARELVTALDALAAQVDLAGRPLEQQTWEVLLLINNSTDASAQIAREFRQAHPTFPLYIVERTLPPRQAHIGYVRKLLMDTACARLLAHPKPTAAILSTDADTRPARDWVAQTRVEIERGAEAVGGRIQLCNRDLAALDPQTRAIHLQDEQYRSLSARLEDQIDPLPFDPWPRHYQHFGGSLAIRPAVYQRVGGVPPRDSLEDVALVEALLRHDVRLRHSPYVRVETSGRLNGRTAVGLAEQLTRWSEAESAVLVPSVAYLAALYGARRELRSWWRQINAGGVRFLPEGLCRQYGLHSQKAHAALQSKCFGAAWELLHIDRHLQQRFGVAAFEPAQRAITSLDRRFDEVNELIGARRSGIAEL